MSQKAKNLLAFMRQPVFIVFAVSSLLMLVSLALTHRVRAYTSDDTAWQAILTGWDMFRDGQVYFGSDPFITKVPIYWLVDQFVEPSRKVLFAMAAVFALANFAAYYYAAVYFLKKWQVQLTYLTLLPFAWLGSFGYFFAQMFLNHNLRNYELGLMFLLFVVVAKVYYKEIQPLRNWWTTLVSLLAVLATGLLIYNDLYFLYFGVAPALLLFACLFVAQPYRRRRTLVVIAGLVGAVVASHFIKEWFYGLGVHTIESAPAQFIVFEKLIANIEATVHSLFIIFGAEFWGRRVADIAAVGAAINAVLLAVVAWVTVRILKYRTRLGSEPERLWLVFFALLALGAVVIYAVSEVSIKTITYRYLVIVPYIGVLFMAYYLGRMPVKVRQVVVWLLVVATVFNIGLLYKRYNVPSETLAQPANSQHYAMLHEIEKRGLTKGYAHFWNANITTYLSGGSATVVPTLCGGEDKTILYRWLISEKQVQKPADRTFFIVDPAFYTERGTCHLSAVRRHFGKPAEQVKVFDKTILIYNSDLLQKMQ